MRLDRFLTLNLVQPMRHTLGGINALVTRHPSRATSLPVLMYHSISDDAEPGVRPYYRICTGPKRFREQMRWLKDNGYRGVTLNAGLAWLDSANPKQKSAIGNRQSEIGNSQPIAITFDDGFRDFYTAAFPILSQHGFAATMYLPTAFIGSPSSHSSPVTRHAFNGKDCLTWGEVRELHQAGIHFGSHSVTHPKLVDLDRLAVKNELCASKAEIEDHLGIGIDAFAYPYAFPGQNHDFVAEFTDLLQEAGYRSCTTTQIGKVSSGDNLLRLKRLPVNSDDDMNLLQAKLEGAYDWLALAQSSVKRMKNLVGSRRREKPVELNGSRNLAVTGKYRNGPGPQIR